MLLNQDFLDQFARRKDVNLDIMRVFLKMIGETSENNVIQVSKKEVSEKMGISQQKLDRALLKLEQIGVICLLSKTEDLCTWRLNPDMARKDSFIDLWEAKKDFLPPANDG